MIDIMPYHTKEVMDAVIKTVTPFIGKTMAESAATAHCQKLAIDSDTMTHEQFEALTHRIHLALNIFVGKEKSQAVIEDIRKAVDVSRRFK